MANSSYIDDHYHYVDVFLATSYHRNLSQWQLDYIRDFPDEGKHCMIDFWSSPKPQGIILPARHTVIGCIS